MTLGLSANRRTVPAGPLSYVHGSESDTRLHTEPRTLESGCANPGVLT